MKWWENKLICFCQWAKKMEKKKMNTFATQWWKWFEYYSRNKNLAGRMVSSLNPLSDILTELERGLEEQTRQFSYRTTLWFCALKNNFVKASEAKNEHNLLHWEKPSAVLFVIALTWNILPVLIKLPLQQHEQISQSFPVFTLSSSYWSYGDSYFLVFSQLKCFLSEDFTVEVRAIRL